MSTKVNIRRGGLQRAVRQGSSTEQAAAPAFSEDLVDSTREVLSFGAEHIGDLRVNAFGAAAFMVS